MGIERLPSAKFATNDLVLACATLAFDILCWPGQNALREGRRPRFAIRRSAGDSAW